MNADATLAEARAWLRGRIDAGERCPCCTQFAKVYRRKIYGTMARTLIRMWRKGGTTEWVDMTAVDRGHGNRGGGDDAKLRYWGLIEPHPEHEALWRVTPAGEQWVLGNTTVPCYARIYDGRCLSLVGDPVTIRQALGKRFDYDELMHGL